MLKTLRKNAMTIAMAAIACAVFTACGTGNDDGAVQPKEVVATKAVVTTAAETEAKTTTTTEAIVDSEPETTTEATKTTTTTEVIETSEPETTTEATSSEANNDGKHFSVEECLEKLVRENYNKEIAGINESGSEEKIGIFSIYTTDNDVLSFYMDKELYYSGENVDIDKFVVQDNGLIFYDIM